MKCEKDCEIRLEKVIDQFNALGDALTPEEKDGVVAPERAAEVGFLFGVLWILAWVLDAEDKMKPMLRSIRFAALADKFGAGSGGA